MMSDWGIGHDRIILSGMQFIGYHGTRPEENRLGQRFVVDVAIELDLRAAGSSDDLSQTVDYNQIHDRARAIVCGPPLKLTEAVAEQIATAVLVDHPQVRAVAVRVTKPGVRLGETILAGSIVEIVRRR
ncbi:dihydroneopterin aldolase [Chloroflexus sp.]|uniref:dihydroneopterin aldolase n=1 Tax=Chloroflexus sp. TaxID=1904827 RepID=UPI002609A67E|nr:dihydroneopterin aldolase [uncultured Chloroflexus sp.]